MWGFIRDPYETTRILKLHRSITKAELPTRGSAGHGLGACKPCAFIYKALGALGVPVGELVGLLIQLGGKWKIDLCIYCIYKCTYIYIYVYI